VGGTPADFYRKRPFPWKTIALAIKARQAQASNFAGLILERRLINF
jgi:hypothetical protein